MRGELKTFLRANAWECTAGCGGLKLFTGLWWIYPPAALIVGGLGLLALGVWGAWTAQGDE